MIYLTDTVEFGHNRLLYNNPLHRRWSFVFDTKKHIQIRPYYCRIEFFINSGEIIDFLTTCVKLNSTVSIDAQDVSYANFPGCLPPVVKGVIDPYSGKKREIWKMWEKSKTNDRTRFSCGLVWWAWLVVKPWYRTRTGGKFEILTLIQGKEKREIWKMWEKSKTKDRTRLEFSTGACAGVFWGATLAQCCTSQWAHMHNTASHKHDK